MKREEIMAVYNAGPQAVIKLVESIILKQQEEILELKERIKALKDRFLKNSSNSNKPPSTDWPTKQRSLRGKSSRSCGGQKGYNLKMVEVADSTTVHKVSTCSSCGSCLKDIATTGYSKVLRYLICRP